jgi:hypothetical protein
MRRFFGVALMLAVVLALLAGCGVGASNSPGDGARKQLEFAATGNWQRVYQQLHPAQQTVVTQDAFIDCNKNNTMTLGKVSIAEERRVTVDVPELGEVKLYEVTLDAVVDGQSVERVMHEIRKGSEWRWDLDRAALDIYREGECPPITS